MELYFLCSRKSYSAAEQRESLKIARYFKSFPGGSRIGKFSQALQEYASAKAILDFRE